MYQKEKSTHSDFSSRYGKALEFIPKKEQEETEDLHNLLYTLHTTPIIDNIGIELITKAAEEDPVLAQLIKIILKENTWIPKSSSPKLTRF